MRVKVSGLNRYKDRHGTLRVYHRKSGTPIDPTLTGQALAAEVARLDKLHAAPATKAGSLAGLLESYKKSPRFTGLAARTQSDYRKIMDYLEPMAEMPLTEVSPGFIARLRDTTLKLKRGGFTNHMLAMLSSVFKHGVEYELVQVNPVTGIGLSKIAADRKRPNRGWTPDERRNVMAVAWPQLRLPLALARFWGVRRGDIVSIPLQAYKDGWLTFRAGKNNALIRCPVLGEFKEIIDEAIASRPANCPDLMLCLNSRGRRWTASGLGGQFDKFFEECRGRGILGPGGSLHGLRHSVGAELKAAGYTSEWRKLVLGHDTDEMSEHYAASADMDGQLIDMARALQKRPKRERSLHNRG